MTEDDVFKNQRLHAHAVQGLSHPWAVGRWLARLSLWLEGIADKTTAMRLRLEEKARELERTHPEDY